MSLSCNYAQRAFPSGLDKMGVTIGISAKQHMGRQRTTYDISHFGHVIVFQFLCCINLVSYDDSESANGFFKIQSLNYFKFSWKGLMVDKLSTNFEANGRYFEVWFASQCQVLLKYSNKDDPCTFLSTSLSTLVTSLKLYFWS